MPCLFVGFDRGFENERLGSKFWVGQDTGESRFADLTLADIFVAIQMGAERSFGIVGVD